MPAKAAQTWEDHNPAFPLSAARMRYSEERDTELAEPKNQTVASKPTPGAEKTVTVGTAGVARIVSAALVGDAAKTEWKVAHKLKTLLIGIDIWKEKGTGGSETAPNKWVIVKETTIAESEEEITIKFEVAPAAKEVFWVQVTG